ncbi:CLUMA_CG004037, isoform A [Clunio marinus]|uniref:CLUMA_CG004037, isoform A n=1 Tax=Clunio marinus TaxID=568069 RepID=A0A1J1HW48_9DIPT|nr:CLUMA_CG004037, isoform A [Clunio marinus]
MLPPDATNHFLFGVVRNKTPWSSSESCYRNKYQTSSQVVLFLFHSTPQMQLKLAINFMHLSSHVLPSRNYQQQGDFCCKLEIFMTIKERKLEDGHGIQSIYVRNVYSTFKALQVKHSLLFYGLGCCHQMTLQCRLCDSSSEVDYFVLMYTFDVFILRISATKLHNEAIMEATPEIQASTSPQWHFIKTLMNSLLLHFLKELRTLERIFFRNPPVSTTKNVSRDAFARFIYYQSLYYHTSNTEALF